MIEQTVIEYLSALLSVPVLAEIPPDPPERFCVVEKTGGGRREGLYSAVLAVQSYAPAMPAVLRLNEAVKDAMLAMDELDGICAVELNADYRFTDPSLRRRRYQAVFDIVYYG